MVVADILEPVYFRRILEQAQCNAVDGRIAPALVEEPSRPIEVVEVVFIRLTSPEIEVRNLEITPEMTCTVAVRFLVVAGPCLVVHEPAHRVILV